MIATRAPAHACVSAQSRWLPPDRSSHDDELAGGRAGPRALRAACRDATMTSGRNWAGKRHQRERQAAGAAKRPVIARARTEQARAVPGDDPVGVASHTCRAAVSARRVARGPRADSSGSRQCRRPLQPGTLRSMSARPVSACGHRCRRPWRTVDGPAHRHRDPLDERVVLGNHRAVSRFERRAPRRAAGDRRRAEAAAGRSGAGD